MNLMSLKNWITVGGGAFLTGAMGFASTHLSSGIPTTTQEWEAFLIGCVVGGTVAVVHLYTTAPTDKPALDALKVIQGHNAVAPGSST